MDFLPTWDSVRPWHWWILGALLLILEVAAPGIFFVWVAIAAFALGLVVFVFPLPVPLQLLLFAGLSAVAVVLGRRYVARLPRDPQADTLNNPAARFVGRTFTVTQSIVNGTGKVRAGDSVWLAQGPDTPQGATVRVTGVTGSVLLVERGDPHP
ncbi:NfeD family protein [Deinococcus maricopensis]|uniref:NfeD-like C-terminal domain-containing protein n=1 Tax=Deinococcus maricopensis (strain DSM 21211 / LMG 22137 / NRRL B-23946 / LB-34) TaxID=709986 RepID=E8U6R7_DEIML|nr:NfeD family protein [Deinococcus maricopensis]ADV66756.1 protein of unknown function DUF107 [Deinococcus maricopensis DSM 21211]